MYIYYICYVQPNSLIQCLFVHRTCLKEVIQVQVSLWEESSATRKETATDFMLNFLEKEVRPLWPKGWVNAKHLFKQSMAFHAVIT